MVKQIIREHESNRSKMTCLLYPELKLYNDNIKPRARFGRVAPLGQPRSVYKSTVECRFLSRNDGQTLKVKVNDLHFQYQLRKSQDAYLVQIWWF